MQKLHIVFPARRGGSQVQILPKIKNGFYFNKFKSRQNAFGIFVWPRITKKTSASVHRRAVSTDRTQAQFIIAQNYLEFQLRTAVATKSLVDLRLVAK